MDCSFERSTPRSLARLLSLPTVPKPSVRPSFSRYAIPTGQTPYVGSRQNLPFDPLLAKGSKVPARSSGVTPSKMNAGLTGPAHRSVDRRRLGQGLIKPVDDKEEIFSVSNGAIRVVTPRQSSDFVFPSMPALPYVSIGEGNSTEGFSLPSVLFAIGQKPLIKSVRWPTQFRDGMTPHRDTFWRAPIPGAVVGVARHRQPECAWC